MCVEFDHYKNGKLSQQRVAQMAEADEKKKKKWSPFGKEKSMSK